MARTTFTGPVKSLNGFEGDITGNVTGNVAGVVSPSSLVLPASTSTLLGDKANAINTAGKVANKAVYNTTTKTIYVAQGSTATSTWIDSADGTTTITPA
jgi:hypothetical protein